MTDNLLEVRGLRKDFGGVVVDDDAGIDVPRGSIVGLIGPKMFPLDEPAAAVVVGPEGLAHADEGYALVAGRQVMAGPGRDLLHDPAVGRLFLGG